MTQTVTMSAEQRERAGKGTARATRREGKIPAVLYGNKQAPALLAFNAKELELLSRKPGFFTHLFDIKIGKTSHMAIARDAQRHPVTEMLLHVDFLRIDTKTRLSVEVPTHFINQEKSPGLKRGGVLNVVLHTITVECAATQIPEHLNIDVSGLEINDSIHAGMLQLPEGVTLYNDDEDFTIATIAAPSAVRSEMNEKAAEEATAATPAATPAAAPAAAKKDGK